MPEVPVRQLDQVTFFAPGTPIAQGSKQAFIVGKRAVLVDHRARDLHAWRSVIADAAEVARLGGRIEGAVQLSVTFVMPRPKTSKRPYPSVPPDIDKLLRAVMDGLTEGGVWKDDGQVVSVSMREVYALPHEDIGVRIRVRGME